MLEGDGILNLIEFGTNPRVVDVAVSVQLGECLEALFRLAVIDKPARRFGEEKDKSGEDDGWDDLDTKTGSPLPVVGRVETNICTFSMLNDG